MTKNLVIALGLTLTAFVPTESLAKPKPAKPTHSAPAKPSPAPNGAPPPGTVEDVVGVGTTSGVMKSMRISKDGTIFEIVVRIPTGGLDQRIKGCGVSSQAHPLLNWAFTNKRRVHIATDETGCFGNVTVPS